MSQGNDVRRSTAAELLVSNRLLALRTMTVGRVTRVFSNGWVEVDPQIQMVVRSDLTQAETPQDIGLLSRIPIGYYKAGGFIITLPVAAGDEGVIMFSDRSLDMWKATGRKAPPRDHRFHDVSDGVFVPWPTSKGGAIAGFNTTGAYVGLEDQTSFLHIGAGGVTTLKAATKFIIDTPLTELTGMQHVMKAVTMDETLVVTGNATAANFLTPGGFNALMHIHGAGTNTDGNTLAPVL